MNAQPKRRALVVDDQEQVCDSIRMTLEFGGYVVETAPSAAAALAKFVPGKFDVVVTDFDMPPMHGDALAAAIRQQAPHQPIVMLTAYGETVRASGRDTSCLDVITEKPFKVQTLLEALEQAIRKHAPHHQAE